MRYIYSVVLSPGEERGFIVEVPSLPGCVTFGETLTEALLNAEEAIEGFLEMLQDDGDPIPVEGDDVVLNVADKREAYVRKVAVTLSGREVAKAA